MIRIGAALAALAISATTGHPGAVDPPRCLVLGWGPWHPAEPTARWRGTRVLTLLDVQDAATDSLSRRVGWRKVRLEPYEAAGRQEDPLGYAAYADSVWLWLAPTPDSLRLLRPAIESRGFAVAGRWQGDTLRGRGHTFSDYVPIPAVPEPVAAVYAVRYVCDRASDRAKALAAIERWRQKR